MSLENLKVKDCIEKLIGMGYKGYRVTFLGIVMTFLSLSVVSALLYSIHVNTESLSNNYKLSIYFKENYSSDKIAEFEKVLIQRPEVKFTRFESKEVALKGLEDLLDIAIEKGENPLNDTMVVTLNSRDELESLQQALDSETMIKEVYYDKELFNTLTYKIARNTRIIKFVFFIGFLPIILALFAFFHGSILSNNKIISTMIDHGAPKKTVLKSFYIISDTIFISGSLIGTLIFLNVYELFRSSFDFGEVTFASTLQMSLLAGVLLVAFLIIFPLLSRIFYKVDGE